MQISCKGQSRTEGRVESICKFLKKPTASNLLLIVNTIDQILRSWRKPFGNKIRMQPLNLYLMMLQERALIAERKDDSNGDSLWQTENVKPYEFVGVCSFCNKVTADWAFTTDTGNAGAKNATESFIKREFKYHIWDHSHVLSF